MLQKSEPPALPNADPVYSHGFQDQFNRILRLYFNQLSSAVNNLVGRLGGRHLETPHGAFHENTSQYAASTTIAYPVQVSVHTLGVGVSAEGAPATRLTVQHSGVYNIQFSLQLSNPDTQIHDVSIWLAKNGANVPDSETLYSMASSHGGAPGRLGAALNYLIALEAGDYVELMWSTTSTLVFIEYRGPQTAPVRPAIPSAIITVQFVSALT